MTTATRLDLLVRQLDVSYDALRDRCAGLTDAEYLWEPVPHCWTVRPTGDNGTGMGEVTGGGRVEGQPPFVTIAGRMAHLTNGCLLPRWDWTFGTRSLDRPREFPLTADAALAAMNDAFRRWRDGLGTLTDDQLDVVGLSQYPAGLDPTLPFGDILWWNNRELIHHGAEIALLRDLWAHTTGRPPSS